MQPTEFWRRRLVLPAYEVREAARYAGVTAQTVRNWQRETAHGRAISPRTPREALSYLQLQELAIVATMRQLGVELPTIRLAREYLAKRLDVEYPFSEQHVKTDGQNILLDGVAELGQETQLLIANKGGQIAWDHMLSQRFDEFEYVHEIALRWKVAGRKSSIVVDPRIAFGAPIIGGTPTWVLRGRWEGGESLDEIANDFELTNDEVREGLRFEQIEVGAGRQTKAALAT